MKGAQQSALKYLWLRERGAPSKNRQILPIPLKFPTTPQALHLKRGVCVILIILQRLTPPLPLPMPPPQAIAKWILWLDSIWTDSCVVERVVEGVSGWEGGGEIEGGKTIESCGRQWDVPYSVAWYIRLISHIDNGPKRQTKANPAQAGRQAALKQIAY